MTQSRVIAVIPARNRSRRFPGKLLHLWRGRPLLQYVWEAANKARRVDQTYIATDDRRIAETAKRFGAQVIMTSGNLRTGSDRVARAVKNIRASVIVNVQGDTFGLHPGDLDTWITAFLRDRSYQYATVACRIRTDDELFNPHCVKVVLSPDRTALWFSRLPVPYVQHPKAGRRATQAEYWGHLGVYLFRPAGLRQFATWRQTTCEKAESLEQLRILEHGGRMKVYATTRHTQAIDTPADLARLNRFGR